jgi:hypothetical protein
MSVQYWAVGDIVAGMTFGPYDTLFSVALSS